MDGLLHAQPEFQQRNFTWHYNCFFLGMNPKTASQTCTSEQAWWSEGISVSAHQLTKHGAQPAGMKCIAMHLAVSPSKLLCWVLKAALQSKRLSLSPSQAMETLPVTSPRKKLYVLKFQCFLDISNLRYTLPRTHWSAEPGHMPGSWRCCGTLFQCLLTCAAQLCTSMAHVGHGLERITYFSGTAKYA